MPRKAWPGRGPSIAEGEDVMDEERDPLIRELRVFMNVYGESDRRVVDLVKQRILNLIDEREACYAEIRHLKRDSAPTS